jgi:NitT/TauT family transport system substrate-binding protein
MMRFILPLFLSVLMFCPLGCKKKSSAASNDITLQLNWKPEPEFGGFYAALDSGAFKKHGLNVTIQPGGASAPTTNMLGAGTVPFAIVNGDEIVRARAVGNKVVAVFAVYQTSPQGIMTRASRGFTNISDIFTHPGTLAMEKGLPYSDFLKQKYGFDKLTIVPSPFGDLSLYRTKNDYAMQCFIMSEPIAAKKAGVEPKTFLIADAGYNPYSAVLATTDDYLAKNPKQVAAMVAAVREGWTAYLKDPSQTNAAMQKLNPTMDLETFAAGAKAQVDLIQPPTGAADVALGEMTEARWKQLVQQLGDLRTVDANKAPKAEECFKTVSP